MAEKIVENAGYSRGELHPDFTGKEDLFLAVINKKQSRHSRHSNAFLPMFKADPSKKMRLSKFRDAIADFLTDPDRIVFRAEFEAKYCAVSAFERNLSRCIDVRFAMEESLFAVSRDLPMSVCA